MRRWQIRSEVTEMRNKSY